MPTNAPSFFGIDSLEKLRTNNPAWRLVSADHAPLVISFLYQVFIKPNKRSLSYPDLVSRLDDFLFHLSQVYGEKKYPRSAKEYIDEWCNRDAPFLRKYYPQNSDEPECDLTPATERAVEWISSLEEKRFIGTESRLLTVYRLLKEIIHTTDQDPASRVAELKKRRMEIDRQINRIENEGIPPYDSTQIKERYLQAEETARDLLSDFRSVEYNFRALDRETREKITTSEKGKGSILDEIFREHDIIWDSDQGKSFRAFWGFLMSPAWQEELEELILGVHKLEDIKGLSSQPLLEKIKFFLLEAGERVYKTNNLLAEQLRKYLDDKAFLENRRIMDIIKKIEKGALEVRENPPSMRDFADLDSLKPGLDFVMERSLFSLPKNPRIDQQPLSLGETDIEATALFLLNYVDEKVLRANIRRALQTRSQISLKELAEEFPIQKGVAEVVAYLNLAEKDPKATVDSEAMEVICLNGPGGGWGKRVRVPRTIFVR